MSEGKEMIDYSKIDLRKVYMRRHLELAVVKVEGDQVTFRIAEQTHREHDFTANGRKFKSSCGVMLNSLSSPEYNCGCTTLYVLGYATCMDDQEITVSLFNFARIMEAVNEYNETDGKGYEKKFPEEGDTFYCITSKMTVSRGEFGSSLDGYEFEMRDAGNCFKTFGEANAALERVKKALNGE